MSGEELKEQIDLLRKELKEIEKRVEAKMKLHVWYAGIIVIVAVIITSYFIPKKEDITEKAAFDAKIIAQNIVETTTKEKLNTAEKLIVAKTEKLISDAINKSAIEDVIKKASKQIESGVLEKTEGKLDQATHSLISTINSEIASIKKGIVKEAKATITAELKEVQKEIKAKVVEIKEKELSKLQLLEEQLSQKNELIKNEYWQKFLNKIEIWFTNANIISTDMIDKKCRKKAFMPSQEVFSFSFDPPQPYEDKPPSSLPDMSQREYDERCNFLHGTLERIRSIRIESTDDLGNPLNIPASLLEKFKAHALNYLEQEKKVFTPSLNISALTEKYHKELKRITDASKEAFKKEMDNTKRSFFRFRVRGSDAHLNLLMEIREERNKAEINDMERIRSVLRVMRTNKPWIAAKQNE